MRGPQRLRRSGESQTLTRHVGAVAWNALLGAEGLRANVKNWELLHSALVT